MKSYFFLIIHFQIYNFRMWGMVWSSLTKRLSTLLWEIANIVISRNKAIFQNTTYWNWFCQWSRCFSSLSLTNLLCSRLKIILNANSEVWCQTSKKKQMVTHPALSTLEVPACCLHQQVPSIGGYQHPLQPGDWVSQWKPLKHFIQPGWRFRRRNQSPNRPIRGRCL